MTAPYPAVGAPNPQWTVDLKTYIDQGAPTAIAAGTGIDPTGVADSSAAIQAIIDSMDAFAPGRLHFPKGTYKIATGLTSVNTSIELSGDGGSGQDGTVSFGGTRIHYTGSGWAFTFNLAAASTIFGGPRISGIHWTGTSSAAGGIRFRKTNNWVLRDVSISDFSGSTAWAFANNDTGTNISQYGVLDNLIVGNSGNGVQLNYSNGVRIIGGYFQQSSVTTVPVASTIGLKVDANSDTLRLYGTDIQGFARAVDILGGANHELHGLRVEDFNNAASAVRLAGSNAAMFGGSINNNLNGNTGTSIEVTAAATQTYLRPANIAGGSLTPITDAGTNTDARYPEQVKIVRKQRGGSNVTINSTSFVAVDSANLDITLTGCAVGDMIEVGVSLMWNNEAVAGALDARTVISGSPVNSVGSVIGGGTPLPSGGIKGWIGPASVVMPACGSVMYPLVSGDISAGSVLIRLYASTATATNKVILSSTSADPIIFWARNHGRS